MSSHDPLARPNGAAHEEPESSRAAATEAAAETVAAVAAPTGREEEAGADAHRPTPETVPRPLAIGDRVRLHGLTQGAEFNSRIGTVQALLDETTGRVAVIVDSVHNCKNVKPVHLTRLDAEESEAAFTSDSSRERERQRERERERERERGRASIWEKMILLKKFLLFKEDVSRRCVREKFEEYVLC